MSLAVVSSASTSPDSMESACSLISSPSLSPEEREQEQPRDENWDSLCDNHMPSKDVTQCCSYFTLTKAGTLEAMFIKSLPRNSVDELVTPKDRSICLFVAFCGLID